MKQGIALLAGAFALTTMSCGGLGDDVAKLTGGVFGQRAMAMKVAKQHAMEHGEQIAQNYVEFGAVPETCTVSGTTTVTISCPVGETITCDGDTYSMTAGILQMTFTTSGTNFSIDMNISGTVNGGDFDSSEIAWL
jgi:hypothetical protein